MEITLETTPAHELRHGVTPVGMERVRLIVDGDNRPLEFKLYRGILIRCPGSTAESFAGQPVNTHPVWIGGDQVTPANGIAIPPGNALHVPIDDPTKLWIISTGNSQRVAWISL